MDDQRVETRPPLCGEDAGDRPIVGRVATEAVDGFGRERDELPGAQQSGGFDDRAACRGRYRGPRPGCGSTPIWPERFW